MLRKLSLELKANFITRYRLYIFRVGGGGAVPVVLVPYMWIQSGRHPRSWLVFFVCLFVWGLTVKHYTCMLMHLLILFKNQNVAVIDQNIIL